MLMQSIRRSCAVVGVLVAQLCVAQTVVVNEVMYHPVGTNLLEQWIEIRNPGTNGVALSGWRVTGDVDFSFPTNAVLPAGGYLVVAADAATFATVHPSVANYVGGWTGVLRHHLKIVDAAGGTANSLDFYGEGDWGTRVMGPAHFNHEGWEWYARHDGLGSTLELVNEGLPNGLALNWASSSAVGGTPGRANSVASTNTAPILLDVSHLPAIPQPSDPVAVRARVVDEHSNGLSLTVHWRVDGATNFSASAMTDDGAHQDGTASDGVYGVILPPQADGTVVEFYLTAQDLEGQTRVYPSVVEPTNSTRTANLLYQVDGAVYAGGQPVYRMIMREVERAELYSLGRQFPDADSDAFMNATWITTDAVLDGGTSTQVRYNAGVRNRGHGTRVLNPNNYHVDIPDDRAWKGQEGINLNANYPHSQVLGSAVYRRLGVPMADSRPVQVRVNGANLMPTSSTVFGFYAANEQYNASFVKRSWPSDSEGNSYRGIRGPTSSGPQIESDLTWHGADFFGSGNYTNAYFKQNNFLENDFSDLIDLIAVLNSADGYAASNYVADVERRLNVREWMRYMAASTLLANSETCLASGVGDDFALYRGTNDTRFLVLPYDLDSVMGRGSSSTPPADSLWRMTALPVMDRFMKNPAFAPLYFRELKQLCETAFAPAQMGPFIDQVLAAEVPQGPRDTFKTFNSNQVNRILALIPRTLTVAHSLATSQGYPFATADSVSLHGTAPAAETFAVRVNGAEAVYSAWEGRWTNSSVALHPGVNRVIVQAFDEAGAEVSRTSLDIWQDDGSTQTVGGNLTANTTWTPDGGPYRVTTSLTVASGATLTVEAGTTVYLDAGVSLTVATGGALVASGTLEAPIRFTRVPGTTGAWGNVAVNGNASSPETRLSHVFFEFNGGSPCLDVNGATVMLDHLGFGNPALPYLHVDGASFVVSDCVFPALTAAVEPVHGTGGVRSGGHGVFLRNYFGSTIGYSDVIDFTGGNRPGGSPVQFVNNVFVGSSDDMLDLDGTDAWVEGNIFLHCHKNGSPDSSSAVSGGNDSGNTSEVTVVGNIFYDCDQAVTAKQGNFYTLLNNTIVRQTHQGGLDTDGAVVNLADDGTTEGAGVYLEGNILVDIEKLVRNHVAAVITFTNNLLPVAWAGPGGGNSTDAPLLRHVPALAETDFGTFAEAQIMRDWLSLLPGSPGLGSGPEARDRGAIIPAGPSITGEPVGTNNLTSATLRVGWNRTGNSIPASGFPGGSGFVAYRYQLDGGPWSGEQAVSVPIVLSGLAQGAHQVLVTGKTDAGVYRDDAGLFGSDAVVTASRSWVVDTNQVIPVAPRVRLNEVLARNSTTWTNAGTTPDLIELHNPGTITADLSGMGLTDIVGVPYKFSFPPGTTLAPGAYLVLAADSASGGAYLHTGFTLKQEGDDLSLFDAASRGGALLDSIRFGIQMADHSVGRRGDGSWGLCRPTPGGANAALATGDIFALRISEWLTDAQFVSKNDFVEVYNPSDLPVDLGGLYWSDAAGSPARHQVPALSYMPAGGWQAFVADGDPGQGADHLGFKLSPDVGLILLSAPDLTTIDVVAYGPQRTDVSQGRSPSGADEVVNFTVPTPGAGNPGTVPDGCVLATETVSLLPMASTWRFNQTANLDGVSWYLPGFDDSAWPSGPALLAVESCGCLPAPGIQTPLTIGRTTYYFRTSFVVNTNLTGFNLNLTMLLDDGAIVYLNGAKFLTNGMSTGSPTYSTTAGRNVDNASTEFLTLPLTGLVQGTNVLAAEVHQTSTGSSDVTWGLAVDATRTYTNCSGVGSVAVVLNEVLADNRSITNAPDTTADFVELFNPSTNAVDLAGLSLTDDTSFPRKWTFPAGATLAAGARLVLICDGALPASESNLGFGLSASGGGLFLFNSPGAGGVLLDGVRYGLQVPDQSLGRVPEGTGPWSLNVPSPGGLNQAAGLGSVSALRVNEWMADPASGGDWVELHNAGDAPVGLEGLYLTDNLADPYQSPIAPLSFIGAGSHGYARFLADGAVGAGADHLSFSLKKGGEALGLFTPAGVMLDGVTFGPQATGVSQGRFPDGASALTSFSSTSTPGGSNYLPLPGVAINEVLTHTDPPLDDAVELLNLTGSAIELGGYYLSNTEEDFRKYRIPDGTVLPAGGFLVIYEPQFNGANASPFTFNSAHGDAVILSQADALGNLTGYQARVGFGAAANGVSFGRVVTSAGTDFTALSARTFGHDTPASLDDFHAGAGAANAAPKVGPIVISEINYLSLAGAAENADEEFIELENLTANPVPWFDPVYPTNLWRLRDAVSYEFPAGGSLAAGARALVVGFDPADAGRLLAFRTRFNVPEAVPVYGPWSGRLGNTDNSVELVRPDAVQLAPHPDAGFVPQLLVDRVHYASTLPWPTAGATGSNSLQRVPTGAYGNEPLNWVAATPTPGRANAGTSSDSDGDGLLDAWELAHFGTLARDGGGDFDADGLTDRQEYLAGTNPASAGDVLAATAVTDGTAAAVEFTAIAGLSYSVQWREALESGAWARLADVPAQAVSGRVVVPDAAPVSGTRFYRVVTPAQP